MKNIAVLIPAHNEEKYIKNALLSLQKQTFKPVAIVVIDDGSTDRTADIVNEFKLRFREFTVHLIGLKRSSGYGKGIVRNLNKGKKWLDENSIQYNFLMILDADQVLSRDYIELCLKKFDLNVAIVGGKTYGINDLHIRGKYRINAKSLRGGHRIYAKWFLDQYPFTKVRAWDSYHYYQAIQNNYHVKLIPNAISYERRPQGRGRWSRGFIKGVNSYLHGYFFPFLIMRAIKIFLISHTIKGGILLLFGYLFAYLKGMQKYPTSAKNLQYQQMKTKQIIMRILP